MIFGWLLVAAQALLGDWLSSKLRLELEVEEEDDLMCSSERRSSAALASAQPAALNYCNFDGTKHDKRYVTYPTNFLFIWINQDQLKLGFVVKYVKGWSRTPLKD